MPRAPTPVTSSTSACRGEAVKNTPSREMSYTGPSRAWISHSSLPSDPASTCRTCTLRRSAEVRVASRARAAATASSVSSPTMSCCRVKAAAPGPVAPADHANTSGRSATHRPQRMHAPWSSRTRPSGPAVIAPVGHSASTPSRSAASPRMIAGPRQESAYSSGRCGHRVVTTPSRSPRSTHRLTLQPPFASGSQCHPCHGQPEAGLDEREVGQDVAGEHLVHQHQVVERRRPGMAADDAALLKRNVVEDLALRRLGPAHRAPLGRLAGDPELIGGPFGAKIVGAPPEQTERGVHLLPPDPQPGHCVPGPDSRAGFDMQPLVRVVRAGYPVVV